MGLFNVFLAAEDKKAQKELKDEYSILNELSSSLSQELTILRGIYRKIYEEEKKSGRAAGALAFEKTLLIEEEKAELKSYDLIRRLKKLGEIGENKFYELEEDLENTEPIDPEERILLMRIINLLQEIKGFLPSLEELSLLPKDKKLQSIEDASRRIVILCKEFSDNEAYQKELIRKIHEHEISPLLKNIFNKPEKKYGVLVYPITENELRQLESDAVAINKCQDKNYGIIWRQWWRDTQTFEKDENTELKSLHVNVTIKLHGEKREIHLLQKAA